MKLTLGFSPCPNDTFIFDALVHHKIDTEGLSFDFFLDDVETLNQKTLAGQPDISKISFGVLPLVLPDYRVLDAGGALGRGTGPLLIAEAALPDGVEDWEQRTVLLPGRHTTAHLLFSLAYPFVQKKVFMPFHEIEQAVLNGVGDAGVIIHENRFTYMKKGLVLINDLGDTWEQHTGQPIPLGGIVMRRDLDHALMVKVNRIIRRSLQFAFDRYPDIPDFVRQHAQEMEETVMRSHIDLYVNAYSLDLGKEGRAAIWKLLEISSAFHPEPIAGSFEVFL